MLRSPFPRRDHGGVGWMGISSSLVFNKLHLGPFSLTTTTINFLNPCHDWKSNPFYQLMALIFCFLCPDLASLYNIYSFKIDPMISPTLSSLQVFMTAQKTAKLLQNIHLTSMEQKVSVYELEINIIQVFNILKKVPWKKQKQSTLGLIISSVWR